MAALVHPRKAEVEALRRIVRGASPAVREGIKWNVPSFRTTEYFATFHLRVKGADDRVRLIFHTGAKVKASATEGVAVADPAGLLLALERGRVVRELRWLWDQLAGAVRGRLRAARSG